MRSLSIFLVTWQLLVNVLRIPNYIIPSPIAIFNEAIQNYQLLLVHSIYTLSEALIGLSIAIVLAYALAILLDLNEKFKKVILKILVIGQTIPLIIIAPIFLIWFGFGLTSKILLVTSICLFPLITNLLEGFEQVSDEYEEFFQVLAANQKMKYTRLKIPGSLPYFLSGLRISITYSISGAVAAEYVGANHGLGMYMARSLTNYNYEMIFAITIIVILMTLILLKIMKIIQKIIMKGRKYG